MNQPVALNAALATSTRKGEPHLWLVCFFIIAVGIVAIAALISDRSLNPDQRIGVFQQSGVYP